MCPLLDLQCAISSVHVVRYLQWFIKTKFPALFPFLYSTATYPYLRLTHYKL